MLKVFGFGVLSFIGFILINYKLPIKCRGVNGLELYICCQQFTAASVAWIISEKRKPFMSVKIGLINGYSSY